MDIPFSFVYNRELEETNVNKINRLFGERVRALRVAEGLTQEKLAERVGVHFTYISQIERGVTNCGIEIVEKIALALDVVLPELFTFPQSDKDMIKRKAMIASEIRKSSPAIVKLFSDILADLKMLAPLPTKRPKKRK